jgi:hypothetical protein
MVDFNLKISRDGANYYDLDLFPDQRLEYSLDFFDSLDLSKIKLPFYTTLKLPLTQGNMAADTFNYDPRTDLGTSFPRDDFHFSLEIYGTAVNNISGILNVVDIEYNSDEPYINVELKDQLAYYLAGTKDVNIAELYDEAEYTASVDLVDFCTYQKGFSGGQEGSIGQKPSSSDAIIFPYVDMNNDLEKFKFPARQFLEYGTGDQRSGLIPAFSVQKFLEYVGDYLSTAGFPVRVDSRLFEVGDYSGQTYLADFKPEDLRFVNSARMLAKNSTNTRNFTIQQATAWVGRNYGMEYMEAVGVTEKYNTGNSVEPNEKWFGTRYWGNMEIHGNAGGVSATQWKQKNWGVQKLMRSYPETGSESIRGWFCPKVSFNADLALKNGNMSITIGSGQLKCEMPVLDEDKMVTLLDWAHADSDIEFGLFVSIYEDGALVKKIRMQDSNGDDYIMTPAGGQAYNPANPSAGTFSNKTDSSGDVHYYDEDGDIVLWKDDSAALGATDVLLFAGDTFYFPADEQLFVNGGSRYSVNYHIEPVGGNLVTTYVSEYSKSGGVSTSSATATVTADSDRFKKIISRIGLQTVAQNLNIRFRAADDFLPHNATDQIVIKDSIEQTTDDTIYDVLMRIMKRFNCGLFYDYDSVNNVNILRIDPMHVHRGGPYSIEDLIDDTKSYKVGKEGTTIKDLILESKDYNRYFDTEEIMKVTRSVNNEGVEDLEVKLDSAVFYKSLCGEEAVERPQNLESGAFSENQLGIAKNIYSMNKDIGFRFCYVKAPRYNTNILHPFIAYTSDTTFSGSMKTETERIYSRGTMGFGELNNVRMTFNGEVTHKSDAGFDLRLLDDDGNPTAYLDLYEDSEGLLLAAGTKVEFSMVVPTSDLTNIDLFMKVLQAPSITSSSIYVKSVDGDVYGDYAYLDVVGLIV